MDLEFEKQCSTPALAHLLVIVKIFLNVIYIIGPIVALVGLFIHLIKLISNPDNKKYKPLVKNWLIALLMLFLLPIIINVVMNLVDTAGFQLGRCWKIAEINDYNGNYNDSNIGGNKKHFFNLGGNNNSTNNNSNNNGSNGSSNNQAQSTQKQLIWIGDSRTVGMKNTLKTNDTWSCEVSKGFSWMKSTGIPNIENKITSNSSIVILMGVNDLHNANNYVNYINSKATEWTNKGARVYFVSVNPTNGKHDNLNSKIDYFNSTLNNNLSSSVKYIDSNSYLQKEGFKTTDGLHYDKETYKKIYNYINNNL